MAKIKLTKSAVDAAQPQAQAVELRDTLVPGFLCNITPAGRMVFMLQWLRNDIRQGNAQLAVIAGGDRFGPFAAGLLQVGEDAQRVFLENLPGTREARTARVVDEQQDAELEFKFPDGP